MFLFYNKSNFLIQGFGVCNFAETGISDYDSNVHTQYEGDFDIPQTYGDLREEIQIAEEGQTLFNISNFTYLLDKGNISAYVNEELVSNYTETSSSSITFNSALNADDTVRLNSIEIFQYIFDENTNTFSKQ